MSEYGNHRDYLISLVEANGWKTVAEVGCGSGKLFNRLLKCDTTELVAGIDLGNKPNWRRNLVSYARWHHEKADLRLMPSTSAAPMFKDASFDMVFIDAAHSFDAVVADIHAWFPKVKPGGVLLGHDYHPKFQGVIDAVSVSFKHHVPEILPHHIWKVQK